MLLAEVPIVLYGVVAGQKSNQRSLFFSAGKFCWQLALCDNTGNDTADYDHLRIQLRNNIIIWTNIYLVKQNPYHWFSQSLKYGLGLF